MSISNDESAISDTTGAHEPRRIVVIGAGPAGLTAAYELMKLGAAARRDDPRVRHVVGGISQTVQRDGWRFDIGGHRFFTKVTVVDELWDEILAPETMLDRPAPEPHPLPRQALRLPARPDERAAQPRPDRGGAVRRCRTSGCASTRRRTRTTSKASTRRASAGGSTSTSSRRTPRRSGACRRRELSADWGAQRVKDLSLVPRGLGGAEAEALAPRRATRRTRSRASSRSSSTRSSARG